MVEDTQVRGAASGEQSLDADIISAWKQDFAATKEAETFVVKVTLDLPSGRQLRAVRMPLILLMAQGQIPDRLTSVVANYIESIEGGDPQKAQDGLMTTFDENRIAAAQKWIDLLNYVVTTVAITPKLVINEADEDHDKGVFWVGGMNFYDKVYVFNWAQGVDSSIENFFREQIDALGTLSDGEGLRVTPEQLLNMGNVGDILAGVPDRPVDLEVGPVHSGQDRRHDSGSRKQVKETADRNQAEVHVGANRQDADRADVGVRTKHPPKRSTRAA